MDSGCAAGGEDEGEEDVKPLQPRVRGLPGNTLLAGKAKIEHSTTDVLRQASAETKVQERVCRQVSASSVGRRREAAAVNLRDLAELRSFRNPPLVASQVLEAVAMLLGEHDKRWARMRKLLDSNLLGRICSFDPVHVSQAHTERLLALLEAPAFTDGGLHERCPPVVSLAAWCCAAASRLVRFPPPPASPPLSTAGRETRDAPPIESGVGNKLNVSGANQQAAVAAVPSSPRTADLGAGCPRRRT